jgi:cell division protein FtsB
MAWASYLALELVFGMYGFVAYDELEEFRHLAKLDLTKIQEQQQELEQTVTSLTTDPETIILEARDIGLISPNEVVLRVSGHDPRRRHQYVTGSYPRVRNTVRDNRPLFRTAAVVIFLAVLCLEILLGDASGQKPWHTKSSRTSEPTEQDKSGSSSASRFT